MTQPSAVVDSPRSAWIPGRAMATIVTSRTITNWAMQGSATRMGSGCPTGCYPQTQLWWKHPRPPPSMRLDGGHPALDLVNTVYGQVGGPVEHDVLATPEDLATFARRARHGRRRAR